MSHIKINELGGDLIYVESATFEFIYSVMLDWLKISGIVLYIAWNPIESMEIDFYGSAGIVEGTKWNVETEWEWFVC